MSPKVSTIAAGFVIASLAATLAVPTAALANTDNQRTTMAHRAHHGYAAHRWHHRSSYYARRGAPAYYDYDHPAPAGGYVFIPGKGIAGESCNMPTSTCSNQYRDTQ
jgi:hypothetical protein